MILYVNDALARIFGYAAAEKLGIAEGAVTSDEPEGPSAGGEPLNAVVTARFQEVLAAALRVPKKRRPTKPTAASQTRRIESKKRRGQIKRLRRQSFD